LPSSCSVRQPGAGHRSPCHRWRLLEIKSRVHVEGHFPDGTSSSRPCSADPLRACPDPREILTAPRRQSRSTPEADDPSECRIPRSPIQVGFPLSQVLRDHPRTALERAKARGYPSPFAATAVRFDRARARHPPRSLAWGANRRPGFPRRDRRPLDGLHGALRIARRAYAHFFRATTATGFGSPYPDLIECSKASISRSMSRSEVRRRQGDPPAWAEPARPRRPVRGRSRDYQ